MADKKWIQDMNLKKGALTETARQHGAITKDGTISVDWLKKAAAGEYGALTDKRATLALSFRKMNK